MAKTARAKFTWEEIETHNHSVSLWIVIDNKVYDLTAYHKRHPGGAAVLLKAAGSDTTEIALEFHKGSKLQANVMAEFEIGSVDDGGGNETEVLSGEEALLASADILYQVLRSDSRIKKFFVADNLSDLAAGLKKFLAGAFEGEEWPRMCVGPKMFNKMAISFIVEVLLEGIQQPVSLGDDPLVSSIDMLMDENKNDKRVKAFFTNLQKVVIDEDLDGAEAGPVRLFSGMEEVNNSQPESNGESGGSSGSAIGSENGSPHVSVHGSPKGSVHGSDHGSEHGSDKSEVNQSFTVFAGSPDDVNVNSFDDLQFSKEQVEETQNGWKRFLAAYTSKEIAGEAVFTAIYEAVPSIQPLFKMPRAVMAAKFLAGVNGIIMNLGSRKVLKTHVEMLGFQHMDLEVTVPRVTIFRDALLDLMQTEIGDNLSRDAYTGFRIAINYAGGAFIYIRNTYAERLKIIAASWRKASGKEANDLATARDTMAADEKEEDEEETESQVAAHSPRDNTANEVNRASFEDDDFLMAGAQQTQQTSQEVKSRFSGCSWFCSTVSSLVVGTMNEDGEDGDQEGGTSDKTDTGMSSLKSTGVPTTYDEMFRFNVAVMGLSGSSWMNEILNSFDAMVANVANSTRLQEECDVLSLRLAKLKGPPIKLAEYKSVMLATLRSLLPKEWNSAYEVAWNWLWENVERMLASMLGKPLPMERLIGRFISSLTEEQRLTIRQNIYSNFFAVCPAGQDYFKQSTARLFFIIDKIFEMTLDIFRDPKGMVDFMSALGLRHVGYGIPIELIPFFVQANIETVKALPADQKVVDAFGWSVGLISRMLVRTINEGSTIVMKAINMNNVKQVRKALSVATRGKRAENVLNVTVGTQSISPLLWSIKSGSFEAAEVIIKDLLTIRADRDRYYFGCDELFERHPDIVMILTLEAPALLPPMLDGLIWRSRVTTNGLRRVNCYLKHLLVDANDQFADAMYWIAKMKDPSIVIHALLEILTDLVWDNITYRSFVRSKTWLLFTIMVFMTSQAILNNLPDQPPGPSICIAVFCCRIFVYVFSMCAEIFTRFRNAHNAYRGGQTSKIIWKIRFPRKFVEESAEQIRIILCLLLLAMFVQEPIWYCLSSKSTYEGKVLFSQGCPEADKVRRSYTILSLFAMINYFILLMDFSALSTRMSAFVLVMTRVLPEFSLFLLSSAYVILMFGSSVSASNEDVADFSAIYQAIYSLFRMAIGIYSGEGYEIIERSTYSMICVFILMLTISVFLLNLLTAQLITAYMTVYSSMVGYARLNRITIICETMPSISQRRFSRFIESLRLDQKLEFGEGDVGLSGGIQVLEPANKNPTMKDSIRRYGGSTAPTNPWPTEDEDSLIGEAAGFDRLEKLVKSIVKKMGDVGGATTKAARKDLPGSSFGGSSRGESMQEED